MSNAEVYWIGASGKKYRYWSKELPYYCDPEQNGNFIFAKMLMEHGFLSTLARETSQWSKR